MSLRISVPVGIYLGPSRCAMSLWEAASDAFFSVSEDTTALLASGEVQSALPWQDVAIAAQIFRELKRRLVALLPPGNDWLDTACLAAPPELAAVEQAALRDAAEQLGWIIAEWLSETTAATLYEDWLSERAAANDPVAAKPEPETGLAHGAALAARKQGICYLLRPRQGPQQRADFTLQVHLYSPLRTVSTDYLLMGRVCGPVPPLLTEGSSVFIQDDLRGLVEEVFLDEAGRFSQQRTLSAAAENPVTLTVCNSSGAELASCTLSLWHGCRRDRPLPVGQNAAVSPAPHAGNRPAQETQAPQPDWKEFARLVRHCLILAGQVADRTGRKREELFEQVYSQERYAEQAFAEQAQSLYSECFDNLQAFAAYLEQLR